ncbi:MAG: hypothetical protein V3T31_07115, partial [candidate division Zixibacteria bacterium]
MVSRLFSTAFLFLAILATSTTAASNIDKAIVYDLTVEQMQAMFGKAAGGDLTSEDSLKISSFRFEGDTMKVLAVLVDWNDRPAMYPKEVIDSLLFSRNVFPGGSMADYYDECSYGKITVTGMVTDWVTDGFYYGGIDDYGILNSLDATVDFSEFDGNGDGQVDAVIFVRSGTGEEDSHDPNDIWSYAMNYGTGGPGPFDGVYVSRWNTSPELQPLHDPANPAGFTGVKVLNNIRVFCHETGHTAGLPDLYDYDDKLVFSSFNTPNDNNDHPVYDWGVMGYYGYGYFSLGSD